MVSHDDDDVKRRLRIEVLHFHDEYISLGWCQWTAYSRDIEQIHLFIVFQVSRLKKKLHAKKIGI